MTTLHPRIEVALASLPENLLDKSGAVFAAGPSAFAQCSAVYMLGLNPGGDPATHASWTVRRNIAETIRRSEPYSSYLDEDWKSEDGTVSRNCGQAPLQKRVKHLLHRLGLDPRAVPSSNLVFERSRNEADIDLRMGQLVKTCWPFHAAVIKAQNIRAVLALGKTAGWWAREAIGAHEKIDHFTETNNRRWRNTAHANREGVLVCTLIHPARAAWSNPTADPSEMVRRVLDK